MCKYKKNSEKFVPSMLNGIKKKKKSLSNPFGIGKSKLR